MTKTLSILFLLISLISISSIGQTIDENAISRGSSSDPQIPSLGALNDVLYSFEAPTTIDLAWGLAFDGQYLYITDPSNFPTNVFQVTTSGVLTGKVITVDEGQNWIGDMASDGTHLFICLVGGSNNILKIDIASETILQTISGDWNVTSQRGLAYDSKRNDLYIGGWNSDMIWQINASSGATISSFPFEGVSGLAWHPRGGIDNKGSLFVVTNDEPSTITQLDPLNGWNTIKELSFPESSPYSGAGAEVDASGALWIADQLENTIKLVDVGVAVVPVSKWAMLSVFLLVFTMAVFRFKRFF